MNYHNGKRALIGALLLVTMTGNIAAQALPPPDLMRVGFDRNVFDYHFSKADRALAPGQWLESARHGVELAQAAWERLAVYAAGDPAFVIEEERARLERWSEEELAERFARWLSRRFFEEAAEASLRSLPRDLDEERRTLLYRADDEGNLIVDENGGDPALLRGGVDGASFTADSKRWAEALDAAREEKSAAFKLHIEAVFPELLEYIAPEKRAQAAEWLRGGAREAGAAMAREMEAIAAREERFFAAQRTGDIWSLRKQSGEESARAISAGLIRGAQERCEKNIAALQTRLDRARGGAADLMLEGEEWFRAYTEQFQAGLAAWQEAEERFFIRRIEWEESALNKLDEGEAAWTAAFTSLSQEREKWERKTKELFDRAAQLFENLSEDTERAINDAKKEFEKEARLRVESAGERAQVWIKNYLSAGSLAASAETYIGFWAEELGAAAKASMPELSAPEFSAWLSAQGIHENSAKNAQKEIYVWWKLYTTYKSAALAARDALIEDFGLVMGAGGLLDIAEEGAHSSAFNLDEYQIELLRAQSVLNYWKKRTEIAQAVSEYAAETDAARATNNETEERRGRAKNEYETALEAYDAALARLSACQQNLAAENPAIEAITGELRVIEAEISRLNGEYNELKNIYAIKDAQKTIQEEMNERYKSLHEIDALLAKRRSEAAYYEYIQKAREYGFTQTLYDAEKTLQKLVEGGAGESSLAGLRASYERISVPVSADAIPGSFADFLLESGLDENARYYALLSEVFSQKTHTEKMREENAPQEWDEAAAFWNDMLIQIVTSEKQIQEAYLGNRIAALRLLGADNGAQWYLSSTGGEADEETIAALGQSALSDILMRGYYQAKAVYDAASRELEEAGVSPELRDLYLTSELCALLRAQGLLEAYKSCSRASNVVMRENTGRSTDELRALFAEWGAQSEEGDLIPPPEEIARVLLADKSFFVEKSIELLQKSGAALSMLPVSLASVMSEWPSVFLDYAAQLAVVHDIPLDTNAEEIIGRIQELDDALVLYPEYGESFLSEKQYLFTLFVLVKRVEEQKAQNARKAAAGEKHWRMSAENTAFFAPSLAQGALKDSEAAFRLSANKYNDLITSVDFSGQNERGAFNARLFSYIDNPALAWQEAGLDFSALLEDDALLELREKDISLNEYRTGIQNEIEKLAVHYDLAAGSKQIVKTRMDALAEEIRRTEAAYKSGMESFAAQSEAFALLGAEYQRIYHESITRYQELAEKRLQFEKEDAIKRWASTAYLAVSQEPGVSSAYRSPAEELAYSRERRERAGIVLQALRDVYDANTEYRVYESPEYQICYETYKKNFSDMVLSIKIKDALEKEIKKETLRNDELYASYSNTIWKLGASFNVEDGDASASAVRIRQLKSIITVDQTGKLLFNTNNKRITAASEEEAARLDDYFSVMENRGSDTKASSEYEAALVRLNQSLQKTITSAAKFKQWGLARDYLVYTMAQNGGGALLSAAAYKRDSVLQRENLSRMKADFDGIGYDTVAQVRYSDAQLLSVQRSAYQSLSAEEKKNLEFYVILSLAGGGTSAEKQLRDVSRYYEYDYVYKRVDRSQEFAKETATILFFMFLNPAALTFAILNACAATELNKTRTQLRVPLDEYTRSVDIGFGRLRSDSGAAQAHYAKYQKSNERLSVLRGECGEGEALDWEAIEAALVRSGAVETDDIAGLRSLWDEYRAGGGGAENVPQALSVLADWSRTRRDESLARLELQWESDKEERAAHETRSRLLSDQWIEHGGERGELTAAIEAAYGDAAAARKNHLHNRAGTTMNNLSELIEKGEAYKKDAADLAQEYAALITRAYTERLEAEYAAREIDWNAQRKELSDMRAAWEKSCALIIEKGRADWEASREKLTEKRQAWRNEYQEEYRRINGEWDAAYLESMSEKNAWLLAAENAVNTASKETLIPLLGPGARQLAKKLDISSPLETLRGGAAENAEESLAELLRGAGIANMENALASLASGAGVIKTRTLGAVGGVDIRNSALVQYSAKSLAKEINDELAVREAKRNAANIQRHAELVKNNLIENIRNANNSFRENMDTTFVREGQWSRSNGYYVKDVLVHSTAFSPIITERASITGYKYFSVEDHGIHTEIETDLREERLNGLSAYAINAIVKEVLDEINDKSGVIFGKDNKKGLFENWVGENPLLKDAPSHENKLADNFKMQGSGELGRLMRYYYHWSIKESNGIAMTAAPLWNKPLWDSRESFFKAPSFSGLLDIGLSIAGTALGGVGGVFLSLADDLLFGAADVAGGYKTWDEAGVAFGKKAIESAVSLGMNKVGGAVLANASGINSAMAKTAIKAGTQAVKTAASGAAAAGLNGINYNRDSGFGYSVDTALSGLKRTGAAALGGVVTTLSSSALDSGLKGFIGESYSTGTRFNQTLSALAGQGVQYAAGGDFTLNLLNLDSFTNGGIQSGLVELRLGGGKENAMSFGTGGVNMSVNNVLASVKGLESWMVNAQLLLAKEEEAAKYTSQMRTLYSLGRGSDGRSMYSAILAGTTNIIENSNAAYTEAKTENGIKTVTLGQNAFEQGGDFGLNVVFAHEASRNGLNDGALKQGQETARAVAAHIRAASGLMTAYGENAVGGILQEEVNRYNEIIKNEDVNGFARLVNGYDSSADYWLVKMDGSIAGTRNDPRMYREIYDGNGNITKELIEGSNETGSQAASLVSLLGEARILKRLNLTEETMCNANNFSDEALKEIAGMSDEEIRIAKETGAALDISDIERKRLLGETLLAKNGYSWNSGVKTWTGGSMSIAEVEFADNVAIIKENDAYKPYTISAMIYRDVDAYKHYTFDEKNKAWKRNEAYKNNTEVIVYYKDLITGETDKYQFQGPLNFIDNLDGSNKNIGGENQQYKDKEKGTVQGATVAPGRLEMRLDMSAKFGEVLMFTNFTDVKGDKFGANGMREGEKNDPRTLYHATKNGNSDSCLVSYDMDGISGAEYFKRNMDFLKNKFNLYKGYSIKAGLSELKK